jgi:hypothetical protein
LEENPSIEAFCKAYPDHILCGEMYGCVQDLNYGCKNGEIKFAAFDVMVDGQFMDWNRAFQLLVEYNVPMVPLFNKVNVALSFVPPHVYWIEPIKYNFESICEMAEGKSTLCNSHCREGVVVRKMKEYRTERGIRATLKAVGCDYLSRKEKVCIASVDGLEDDSE